MRCDSALLCSSQRALQEKLEAAYLAAQEKSRDVEEKREAESVRNAQVGSECRPDRLLD